MLTPPHNAVVVSPATTIAHVLMVSAFRALAGMFGVLWIAGMGASPILIPGILACLACMKAGWSLDPRMARIGLCLSSAMWVGAAAAVLNTHPTHDAVFLAAAIASFAVTDMMMATMRIEQVP